uniref:Uncharacterized protein n=1 Tax=viral metagenome TaxID=1070528 RepID=A0A6M3K7Z8_9ZZZZ
MKTHAHGRSAKKKLTDEDYEVLAKLKKRERTGEFSRAIFFVAAHLEHAGFIILKEFGCYRRYILTFEGHVAIAARPKK